MKILAFSSIRSDYDLMSGLYKKLDNDETITFKLVVSGAHLSSKFGHTINQLYEDNLDILPLFSLLDSDTPGARIKSASIFLQSLIDIALYEKPDLLLMAGDREDVIMIALLGLFLQIPTVHFFGGDHEKDGHADTLVRHATSKLATIHCVANEEHQNRLIAMGESPSRIFNIGSISLDRFYEHTALSKQELIKTFPTNKQLSNNFALVIFHPLSQEQSISAEIFDNIIQALKQSNISMIISYPNSDPGHDEIIKIIHKYEFDNDIFCYHNLPRDYFLSIFKNASFIIGNSSAGIYEAASIPIPAINVGLRQYGRLAAENVVFTDTDIDSLKNAITLVSSKVFRQKIRHICNPYGDGNSVNKALHILKTTDFNALQVKTDDPLEIKKCLNIF